MHLIENAKGYCVGHIIAVTWKLHVAICAQAQFPFISFRNATGKKVVHG